MKDLSKHIEFLLLDHECVIYPDLGAFITSYISSKWSQEENLFLPPYRSVWFNPQLKEDDDLFVSTLARRYHISHADAALLCAEYLEELNQELEENGTVEVGSIGALIREEEDAPIIFAPSPSGVCTPGLYGLDTVQIPLLPEKSKEEETFPAAQTDKPAIHTDERHITIRIRRSLVNYLTSAAASIILFLAFSTPAQNTAMTEGERAQTELFIPSNLMPRTIVKVQKEMPKEITAEAATETANEATTGTAIQETGTQEETAETSAPGTTQAAMPQPAYAMVLASSISLKNAQSYVETLQARGLKAEVLARGKMVRVVIPGFQTAEEVHRAIKELQKTSSEFSKAWTLKLED